MEIFDQKKTILFAGGETGGPVAPLLAIAEYWQKQDPQINPVIVDVKRSAAAHMAEQSGYIFAPIITGKLHRHITWKLLLSPLLILIGLFQSLLLIREHKPILIIGAGGYVQFPLIVAAWLMKVPRLIHQQDLKVTLSNRITSPLADKITTTFQKSVKDFPQGSGFNTDFTKHHKVVWTGNPIRNAALQGNKKDGVKQFGLDPDWPVLLVIGGGSGAQGLNDAIEDSLFELLEVVQILHSVGKREQIAMTHPRYHQYPFIDPIGPAYAAADIVVSRAGIGAISELAKLKKVSIIVPMPGSHQEVNAELLYREKAAMVVDQTDLNPDRLLKSIRKLLIDSELQKQLSTNIGKMMPGDANEKVYKVIKELINDR